VLFVSLLLWFTVVYSVLVVLRGNPAFVHVFRAESALVAQAEALVLRDMRDAVEEEVSFLRKFFLLSLLELLMFITEVAVLGCLWWLDVMPKLTFCLFAKDLFGVAVSLSSTWFFVRSGVFETILSLPKSLLTFERISAFFSAIGGFVLLLHINGIGFAG